MVGSSTCVYVYTHLCVCVYVWGLCVAGPPRPKQYRWINRCTAQLDFILTMSKSDSHALLSRVYWIETCHSCSLLLQVTSSTWKFALQLCCEYIPRLLDENLRSKPCWKPLSTYPSNHSGGLRKRRLTLSSVHHLQMLLLCLICVLCVWSGRFNLRLVQKGVNLQLQERPRMLDHIVTSRIFN